MNAIALLIMLPWINLLITLGLTAVLTIIAFRIIAKALKIKDFWTLFKAAIGRTLLVNLIFTALPSIILFLPLFLVSNYAVPPTRFQKISEFSVTTKGMLVLYAIGIIIAAIKYLLYLKRWFSKTALTLTHKKKFALALAAAGLPAQGWRLAVLLVIIYFLQKAE